MIRPCPTGQKAFTSRIGARLGNQTNSKRIRAFVCPSCAAWHITSQPPDPLDFAHTRRPRPAPPKIDLTPED